MLMAADLRSLQKGKEAKEQRNPNNGNKSYILDYAQPYPHFRVMQRLSTKCFSGSRS